MAKGTSTKTTKKVRSTVAGKVAHASAAVHRPGVDEVATRAYQLFLEEGGQHGRHLEHWLRAEEELGLMVR